MWLPSRSRPEDEARVHKQGCSTLQTLHCAGQPCQRLVREDVEMTVVLHFPHLRPPTCCGLCIRSNAVESDGAKARPINCLVELHEDVQMEAALKPGSQRRLQCSRPANDELEGLQPGHKRLPPVFRQLGRIVREEAGCCAQAVACVGCIVGA